MRLTFLKQIVRSLLRRKFYTSINILGLGIGLGCVILMATYIIHEFSFDKYHSKSSNIYRVIDGKDCNTYYAMGEAFKNTIPEIQTVCRLFNLQDIKIKSGLQFIQEENIFFSDPEIFQILDINMINGKSDNQLKAPDEIMISQRIADKYFKKSNPVGQVIEMAIEQKIINFRISGVFQNFPSNSSIQTDFIGNIEKAFSLLWDIGYTIGFKKQKEDKNYRQIWERNDFTTLILMNPNCQIHEVEKKCSQICLKFREANPDGGIRLQEFAKMYLHSSEFENADTFMTNQLASLKVFMCIGILILLVAIVNFIMISNADNNLSIKEIACRKVNGASKKQILIETLYKSVFIAFISLLPALIFIKIMIPIFNNLFQKDLSITLFFQFRYILALIVTTLITGLSAGIYLGLFISRTNPINLFQKNIHQKSKWGKLNGSLVIVQFIVFILLSSSFLLMQKQYNYSLHKDLGLNSKNIIAININDDMMKEKAEYIKNELLTNPNVIDCKATSFTVPPSDNYLDFGYKDKETGKPGKIEALVFGQGILEMLQIPVIEGRSYSPSDVAIRERFIINEAAAKKYNVRVGDKIGGIFEVVGIVRNFHYHSLHKPVDPVFIALQTSNFSYLLIKTNGKNNEIIDFSRQLFQKISPSYYMEYELLDDRITNFYKKEEKQMGTVGFFSAIALSISIMGLLGFVSISLLKKRKEIGIRKVNGAKTYEIINHLNWNYIKWIVIAFIISCPIAWYAMHKWLENFAYKTELSWWIFVLAGLLAFMVALLTVSWQSWRAARRNPVESLHYE